MNSVRKKKRGEKNLSQLAYRLHTTPPPWADVWHSGSATRSHPAFFFLSHYGHLVCQKTE